MLGRLASETVQSAPTAPTVVVIGVGNDYRRDDGVGPLVARALRKQLSLQPAAAGVRISECAGGSFDLIDSWEGAAAVILVDAAFSGAIPGTIHRIDARYQPIPSSLFHYSTHGFGVAETIELAKLLGKLPPRMVVFGIEGADFGQGEGLSQELGAAMDGVTQSVLSCILTGNWQPTTGDGR